MAHRSDTEFIQTTHNTARFFIENRHISWVLLVGVLVWGVYGYAHIAKRKDPNIPVRIAVATCPWPGVNAEKVEQLVTRPMEQKIAENRALHVPGPGNEFGIKSLTLPGLAILHIQLSETVANTEQEFNDINLKLNSLNQSLPQGAGPIQFNSGFGETAALMLTVASPKEREIETSLRARMIKEAIDEVRSQVSPERTAERAALVVAFPRSINTQPLQRLRDLLLHHLAERAVGQDLRPLQGPGFVGIDGIVPIDDAALVALVFQFARERLGATGFHPDAWQPVVIRDSQDTAARLAVVVGDKYTYRELDNMTDLIQRTLQTLPLVSKVERSGVLPEQVFLTYSQEQLASYGLQPTSLRNVLSGRNITAGGGLLQVGDSNLLIDPSGEFTSSQEIGDVAIAVSSSGTPVYLRDLVETVRGYQDPPRFLNFYTRQDASGAWRRSRAITLAVQMRAGEQIGRFGEDIDAALAGVRANLPEDLIMARTSDQPLQVRENLELFMDALYEAIILVVVTAWLGFWEWRSALLMALSIPLTLAMTFGMIFMLRLDLQQVSIATLIIALGLLVDDPVVAGDAIKRELTHGHPPLIAAWLGPTKPAEAIEFATITNMRAHFRVLLLSGNTGDFIYSLPIVMACTLLASRVVSMTFVPFIGYYLLRAPTKPELPIEERRRRGFTGFYYRLGVSAINHRWLWALGSLIFLVGGGLIGKQLSTSFFPEDVQYLSHVEIWLPNNAPLSATNAAALRAEEVVRQVTEEYGRHHTDNGKPLPILHSLTTFVGGGGPRFWFSVSPELQQLNFAQLIIEVINKEDTPYLVSPLQHALSAAIPGARIQVHQLETNPVDHPIEVHIAGRADVSPQQAAQDIRTLHTLAEQIKTIFRALPQADSVYDDWGEDGFLVKLQIDPDRANLAGVTNLDVARSSATGINGAQVTTLREGDKQIPVVARLRAEERAQLSDIQNLYVYSSENTNKIPLLEVSSLQYQMATQRIRRREHFRTISVVCFPTPGVLASTVLNAAQPQLHELMNTLPAGYHLIFAGEKAKQQKGFHDLAIVMAISVAAIFLTLVIQFRNAVKPLLVFAAVPYGIVGALAALYFMDTPFGFMAFLGIASLVGVIVSHVIVLFDFIELNREHGEPLQDSLLDAGIVRLRPIMITVGATVLALIPLALHGGPLWEPLCYAQIGGLALATFIELLLVKVFYAIVVLDLKLISWDTAGE